MPKTPDYFKGKTIVITGAGSGIGRATALIFAREGANVVCADIDEDGVAKTAEAVNKLGAQSLALTIDVTKRAAVEDMIELALNDFDRVHFLFNSAGAAIWRSKFLDIDDDLFDHAFSPGSSWGRAMRKCTVTLLRTRSSSSSCRSAVGSVPSRVTPAGARDNWKPS